MRRHFILVPILIIASISAAYVFLSPECAAEDTACWDDTVRKVVAEGRVSDALFLIEEAAAVNSATAAACHSLAHAAGETAAGLFLDKKSFEIGPRAPICGYGFYHGFLEKMLHASGDEKSAAGFCEYAEVTTGDRDAGPQCFHGIGHGLVADPSLLSKIDRAVPEALRACARIAPGEDRYFRCASGVFNAWSIAYTAHPDLFPRDTSFPFQFCGDQAEEDKVACYGNLNVAIAKIAHNDFGPALGLTFRLADPAYVEETVRYLAAYFVSFTAAGDPQGAAERLAPHCEFLPAGARRECVVGIAHGYLELGGLRAHATAEEFCSLSPLLREPCKEYVAQDASALRGR